MNVKKAPADAARKLKRLLVEISPLMEEYTAQVCPSCTEVCCKQKRSVLDQHDAAYVRALEVPLPPRDPALPPEGPCQFMGWHGCMTPRWLRPWRCTWYFCDSLLEAINEGPQKKARLLSSLIREILDIRSSW